MNKPDAKRDGFQKLNREEKFKKRQEEKQARQTLVKELINKGNSFKINKAAKNFAEQCGTGNKVTRTQVRKLFGALRKVEISVNQKRPDSLSQMGRLVWLAENDKNKKKKWQQGRIFYEDIVQTALKEFEDSQFDDLKTDEFMLKFRNLMSLMEAIVAYLPEK